MAAMVHMQLGHSWEVIILVSTFCPRGKYEIIPVTWRHGASSYSPLFHSSRLMSCSDARLSSCRCPERTACLLTVECYPRRSRMSCTRRRSPTLPLTKHPQIVTFPPPRLLCAVCPSLGSEHLKTMDLSVHNSPVPVILSPLFVQRQLWPTVTFSSN